jgi:hypothetical protein
MDADWLCFRSLESDFQGFRHKGHLVPRRSFLPAYNLKHHKFDFH